MARAFHSAFRACSARPFVSRGLVEVGCPHPGDVITFTRREFGKLALAGVPAAAFYDAPFFGAGLVQARPNSLFNGVQIGAITYSYRQMPDQSAEATLKYIVDSGISAVEL